MCTEEIISEGTIYIPPGCHVTMNSILINSHKQFESNYDITKTTIKVPDFNMSSLVTTFHKHPTILNLTDFTSLEKPPGTVILNSWNIFLN